MINGGQQKCLDKALIQYNTMDFFEWKLNVT